MAQNPVDLGQDFIKSGMRLITHPSSDVLLDKADDFVERWHE